MSEKNGAEKAAEHGQPSRAQGSGRSFHALWRADAWVRPFLARYKKALAASLALSALVSVFAVGLMSTSGYLISDAAERPELGLFSLLVPLGLVQVFGIGRPFLAYAERLESHDWVLRVSSGLRARLYDAVEKKGVFWSAGYRAGELLGLLADDIGHVQNLYLRTVLPLATAWALWIAVVLAFGLASPRFALVMALGLGVLCLLVPLASLLANGARQMRAKQLSGELYARVLDDVSGIADWAFAQRPEDFAAHSAPAAASFDAERSAVARSSRRFGLLAGVVFSLLSTAVLVWAAMRFAALPQAAAATGVAGRPADLVAAFVIGFFPLLEAFAPLPGAAAQAGEHAETIERLNALDSGGSDSCSGGTVAPGTTASWEGPGPSMAGGATPSSGSAQGQRGGLSCREASFAYPGGRELLHGVTLEIPAREKLAVLGPSGSGKSTLLALLRGDLRPSSGSIAIDGAPTCELGDAACEHFGFVQQDTYLFDATIYENLALGDAAISREDAAEALAAVGLEPLLARLPRGLDTRAGEAGLRFSGGERHRIALARVLLRKTPVVLLDEPTVGLDPITEHGVLATLFDVLADRTVVMVTHHLAGIERMNRVVFLEGGRVTLDGSPSKLAATSERYRQLLALDRGW